MYNEDPSISYPLNTGSVTDPMNTGFKWVIPTESDDKEKTNSGRSWIISGHDMQVLSSTVPPGGRLVTEQKSFMFMHPDMETEVTCTLFDGCSGCSRLCGGESCIKVNLINNTHHDTYAGVTPSFPSKIIPVHFEGKSNGLVAKPGAYMSEVGDVDVGCNCDYNCLTCCCGGLGMCRQKIKGEPDSVAFLAAGGTIVVKELGPGETFILDPKSLVAFEDSMSLCVTPTGGCSMCCWGGEGCCYSTLTGPGKVWVQSMSFGKYRGVVAQKIAERQQRN